MIYLNYFYISPQLYPKRGKYRTNQKWKFYYNVNNSSYLIEITSFILSFSHQWLVFILNILFSVQNCHPLVFNYRDAHIDSTLDFNSQLKNYLFDPIKLYSVASLSPFINLCGRKIHKDKTHKQTLNYFKSNHY